MSRKGGEHTIRELEVVTLLTLDNTKVTNTHTLCLCGHLLWSGLRDRRQL